MCVLGGEHCNISGAAVHRSAYMMQCPQVIVGLILVSVCVPRCVCVCVCVCLLVSGLVGVYLDGWEGK